MISLFAAYLLLIAFMAIGVRLRVGQDAGRADAGQADRRSTGRLGQTYAVGFLLMGLAPLLNYFWIGFWAGSWFPGWLGVALMIAGIALRVWSVTILGQFYTRTLLTTTEQRIVQAGPYRLLRHPGYAGSLLVWAGAGLAAANWIVFSILTLMMALTYAYRMRAEEAMLVEKFGQDYLAYIKRTKRIIPFVY